MDDHANLNAACNAFHKQYSIAKNDLFKLESLVKTQLIPIDNAFASDAPLECREGCAHCCQLRVVAFPHELIAIYLYINRTFSRNDIRAVKDKVAAQFKKIKNLTLDEHFTTNIECPLLEKNKCSIYPVRPLSCAGYNSTSEAACKDSNENPHIVGHESGGIPMVMEIKLAQELQVYVAGMVIHAAGDDAEQYELIGGLHAIYDDPSIIQRWVKGRKFQNKR